MSISIDISLLSRQFSVIINVNKTTNLYAIMTPEKTVWQQQFAGFF